MSCTVSGIIAIQVPKLEKVAEHLENAANELGASLEYKTLGNLDWQIDTLSMIQAALSRINGTLEVYHDTQGELRASS